MKHELPEDNILIITKQMMDQFLKTKNPQRLIALYMFYYYTAKWQDTSTCKATTGYVAKGLHWGEDTVRRNKKKLIKMGLIEDVQKKDKEGKIVGWYVKVKYRFKTNIIPHDSTLPQIPHRGEVHSVDSRGTNAPKSNSLNAPKSNKEILGLPSWLDEKVWQEWETYRKEIKKKLTKTTKKRQLKFLADNREDHKEIIARSITNGWTGLFPLDKKESKPELRQTATKSHYADSNAAREKLNQQLKELKAKQTVNG